GDFSLDLKPGEWACITGKSGCGKTSLLRAVLGFQPLDSGRIFVGGEELSARTVERIRQRTSYLPQELFLPVDTVGEMWRIPFELKSSRHIKMSEEKLFQVWHTLGLEKDLLRLKVVQLSGGQRQRILLSMAALLGRGLLLADEPTSALDEECVGRVVDLLRSLTKEGTAVLTVSHNRTLFDACDKVVRF
ncbi:MAG: ATP-binding cassette domain-containing protein, partial [Paraprevotella sp.]|nr:ATP-binding cassette domain-containing protein [Paraprevotella sp.]